MELLLGRLQKKRIKGYVESINGYRFESLTELIFALFSTYKKGTEDWEEIQILLANFGYNNLNGIKESEIPIIRKWLKENKNQFELEKDIEYLTYKLLTAIVKKDILVYIDKYIIENVNENITVSGTSTISFIDTTRLNQLTFTTI